MKNILLITILICTIPAHAQEDKYIRTMKATIDILDTAKTSGTFMKASNKFERIANAEKDEWLPYYWAAFSQLQILQYEKDSKAGNDILSSIDRFLTTADSLSPDNSEIYVLRGWWYSSHMQFGGSPMQYGPLSGQTHEKAIKLNPENPRGYTMKGLGVFYTPAAFGGGKPNAKPVFDVAMEKYGTFKPESEIHPDWGKELTEMFMKMCDEE